MYFDNIFYNYSSNSFQLIDLYLNDKPVKTLLNQSLEELKWF